MKLSVIFPVHNQFALSEAVMDVAKANLSGETDVEFIALDNGSESLFAPSLTPVQKGQFVFKGIRLANNMGVYPLFWEGLKYATGDIIAYFHSDLFVAEKDWDKRLIEAFEKEPNLGLVGFIGSDEIDGSGGRGLGTSSNFLGQEYHWQGADPNLHGEAGTVSWKGSPAEVHGRRIEGQMKAAVVDGCAMVFRRSVLEQIPERPAFPPHHFYDRLLSCEVMERGYDIAVLGIGFDHISGQTVNQEASYHKMAEAWCVARGIPMNEGGWDATIYREAERQWLTEYRDEKHFIPRKV